jgi:uncharacterized protein DUF3142
VLAVLAPSSGRPRGCAIDALPRLMLWAWERPEDLRGLPPDTGVAFLAETVVVTPGRIDVRPRLQPLDVSPGTPLLAVTRIESGLGPSADRAAVDERAVAATIAATAVLPQVIGVQVDFDATASERQSFTRILRALRVALGPRPLLSITALASWCLDDRWIDDLPVDEVVPMLFRLGPAGPGRDRAAASLRGEACRAAAGISLDEPVRARLDSSRVYVFSPTRWTPPLVAQARVRASGSDLATGRFATPGCQR